MKQLALLFALVSLASCVANKPYRAAKWPAPSVFPQCAIGAPSYSIETFPGGKYGLAFVEFDDRGEFFDRCQLVNARQAIRDAKTASGDVITAVFVHGWKNNASDSAGNVPGFRDALQHVVQLAGGRPVVGIYVAWRGAVVSAPLVKELTFWNRRDKARNLPRAHMAELIREVTTETKGKANTHPSASLVLVGHSFGGAVLESAMTPLLVDWLSELDATDGTAPAPADLLVYINQAAPAVDSIQTLEILAAQNRTLTIKHQNGSTLPVPLVLSITSRGDSATKVFFSVGQTLSRPRNSLRQYPGGNAFGIRSQGELFFQTTANTTKLQSHVIGARNSAEVKAAKGTVWLEYQDTAKNCYQFVTLPTATNKTPYWVSQLPVSIVPDHSFIFTPAFVDFLSNVMLRASRIEYPIPACNGAPQPLAPTTEKGVRPAPRVMEKR